MGCLHDPANVQQTSSKCIQNTRANAGRLLSYVIMELDVCWKFAGRLLDRVNTSLITHCTLLRVMQQTLSTIDCLYTVSR